MEKLHADFELGGYSFQATMEIVSYTEWSVQDIYSLDVEADTWMLVERPCDALRDAAADAVAHWIDVNYIALREGELIDQAYEEYLDAQGEEDV